MKYINFLIKTLLLTCFLALILWYNLGSNYVFYYNSSTVTDKSKLPFVIIDYLAWEKIDGSVEDGYKYRTSGLKTISYSEGDRTVVFHNISFYHLNNEMKYELTIIDSNHIHTSYYFDNELDIKYKTTSTTVLDTKEEIITIEDNKLITSIFDYITENFLKNNHTPLINFQWLFDWTLSGHKLFKVLFTSMSFSLIISAIRLLIRTRLNLQWLFNLMHRDRLNQD